MLEVEGAAEHFEDIRELPIGERWEPGRLFGLGRRGRRRGRFIKQGVAGGAWCRVAARGGRDGDPGGSWHVVLLLIER
jgi:hypothetical protein